MNLPPLRREITVESYGLFGGMRLGLEEAEHTPSFPLHYVDLFDGLWFLSALEWDRHIVLVCGLNFIFWAAHQAQRLAIGSQ